MCFFTNALNDEISVVGPITIVIWKQMSVIIYCDICNNYNVIWKYL